MPPESRRFQALFLTSVNYLKILLGIARYRELCQLFVSLLDSTMPAVSKKRKRAAEDDSDEVTLKLKQPQGKSAGVVLGA